MYLSCFIPHHCPPPMILVNFGRKFSWRAVRIRTGRYQVTILLKEKLWKSSFTGKWNAFFVDKANRIFKKIYNNIKEMSKVYNFNILKTPIIHNSIVDQWLFKDNNKYPTTVYFWW
jgi:hypothetical protein